MESAIYFAGAVQAFVLAIFLHLKKNASDSDRVLSLWTLSLGAHLTIIFLFYETPLRELLGQKWSDIVWNANAAIALLQGPFLYGYALTLLRRKRIKLLPHLLPSLLFVLTCTAELWTAWFLPLVIVIAVLYIGATGVRVVQYFNLNTRSENEEQDQGWLRFLVIALAAVVGTVIYEQFFSFSFASSPHSLIFIAVSTFLVLLAIVGLVKGPLLRQVMRETQKYESSPLAFDRKRTLMHQLEIIMETEQMYLDSELSLTRLAEKLDVKENDLSQTFSSHSTSFYSFLNQYRVSRAKEMLSTSKYNHLNMLGIAYESGFRSKATFYRAFQTTTGLTPGVYRAKQADPGSPAMTR